MCPIDPLKWTVSDVQYWIKRGIQNFKLPDIVLTDWNLCGKDVFNFTFKSFKQKVPIDVNNYFWIHFQIIRKCKLFAVPYTVTKPKLYNARKKEAKSSVKQLWQFLLQLLIDQAYSEIIKWEGEDGTFRLLKPRIVAQLWGVKKRRINMTYDKFSRALRFYYRTNIIQKVMTKRFCYKFICNIKDLVGFSPKELQQQMFI